MTGQRMPQLMMAPSMMLSSGSGSRQREGERPSDCKQFTCLSHKRRSGVSMFKGPAAFGLTSSLRHGSRSCLYQPSSAGSQTAAEVHVTKGARVRHTAVDLQSQDDSAGCCIGTGLQCAAVVYDSYSPTSTSVPAGQMWGRLRSHHTQRLGACRWRSLCQSRTT